MGWSLSARRAWIEIIWIWSAANCGLVALRKESVDRNKNAELKGNEVSGSLSARRAWIEISRRMDASTTAASSLSARRAWIEMRIET